MSSAKARGRLILAETRELAAQMKLERERYWRALLARPQLAGPITYAVQLDLDAGGWATKLEGLVGLGCTMVESRRAAERNRYLAAVAGAAQWLASTDRRCVAANACAQGVGLWAARQLPDDHRWGHYRLYPARPKSRVLRRYWAEVQSAKSARERARNRIVVINEGLVVSAVAKWPWARGHLTEADLQQTAREGLMVAADRYDISRAAFSTYGMWWIRALVFREHQNKSGEIRAPTAVQALAHQLADTVERNPGETPEQILARWLKGDPPKTPTVGAVERAMAYMGRYRVSFDQSTSNRTEAREGLTLADTLPDQQLPADEQIHEARILERLTGELAQLPREARSVITAIYGLGHERAKTPRELAREGMGTALEIEQLAHNALQGLRERMTG